MNDRTHGTLRIDKVPEWTDADAERLALLEGAFDAAGCRGVVLAEELDALRVRRDLLGPIDEDHPALSLIEWLADLGWRTFTNDADAPVTEESFHQEDISCGYVDYDYDDLQKHLQAAGISYTLWEDPKYEWLGSLAVYTPELGLFASECDADGNPVLSPGCVLSIAALPPDEIAPALLAAIGAAWTAQKRANR